MLASAKTYFNLLIKLHRLRMVHRSSSSGLSVAVMRKQASKYNAQEGALLLEWIKKVTGVNTLCTDGAPGNFMAQLKDGTMLCKMALKLEPNLIKGMTEKAGSAFQQMSNLELFIEFCRKQGVITQELFRAVDLVEARDLYSVCMTLNSLGRIMAKHGKTAPRRVSVHKIANLPLADQLRIHKISTF